MPSRPAEKKPSPAAAARTGGPIPRPGPAAPAVQTSADAGVVFRCAKCGRHFATALVPALYRARDGGQDVRLSAPVLPDGSRAAIRMKTRIGGRDWCEECAAARFRRRPNLSEWSCGLQGPAPTPVPGIVAARSR